MAMPANEIEALIKEALPDAQIQKRADVRRGRRKVPPRARATWLVAS